MKPSILTTGFVLTLALSLLSGEAAMAQSRPAPRTNREAVLGTGATIATPHKTKLEAGLYQLGAIRGSKNAIMVLTENTNDSETQLGMILERDFARDSVTTGRLVIARQILGGAKVMISPLKIDTFGNIVSASETDTDAPVFLVSRRSETGYRFPYIVEGKNGATNGQLMGMTKAANTRFELMARPSANIFRARNSKNRSVVFDGATLSIYAGNVHDLQYQVVPLNGEIGGIAGLTSSSFDTMGEWMTSGSDIQRVAFFIKNASGHEMLLIGTPSAGVGVFRFDGYSEQSKTLIDFLDRGRL